MSFALPFSQTGRRYYSATSETSVEDFSFAFVDEGRPCAVVECDSSDNGVLTRFGSPIEPLIRPELEPSLLRRLVRDVLGELRTRAREAARPEVRLRTNSSTDPDGVLASRLLEMKAEPALSFRTIIDTALDPDAMLGGMRQGHRQQVRWGRENLHFANVDSGNADRQLFDRYRELHAAVAGRVTRPDASWQAMFDLIVGGEGDLILSELNGELVGGSLILDAGEWAFYASGAYRRDRMAHPLAHYPIFFAAQRAASRGRRWFDVGESSGEGRMSEKERSIAAFKSGFSSRARSSIIWTLPA